LKERLGQGEVSEVYLAHRIGPMPFLTVIKLSSATHAAAAHAREAKILRELTALACSDSDAHFALLLPEVVTVGMVEGDTSRHALVLKAPNGYWGSLAALHEHFPQGLDPRHAVWIWRRLLAMLAFLHSRGWAHGDVRPEHALVHPSDHGVRLIGWTAAQKTTDAMAQATDLMRSARIIHILLSGTAEQSTMIYHIPIELASLVNQAANDTAFCQQQGALGLDSALRNAARAAFGPPAYVPLHL
jgi:serine/threonine protein kinase